VIGSGQKINNTPNKNNIMKLDQNIRVCAEFTYLLEEELRIMTDGLFSFAPVKVMEFLDDDRIYKAYNDSQQILEVVSKFLTPNELIDLYKSITAKFEPLKLYPSSKFDLCDDGGCHLSYKVHPFTSQIIKNLMYLYPTMAWVWAAPNCMETVLDNGPKYTWINTRLYRFKDVKARVKLEDGKYSTSFNTYFLPRNGKDFEVEFRMFTMPNSVSELKSQIHFSQCLINYVDNLLNKNPNLAFSRVYGTGPYNFLDTKKELFKGGLDSLKRNYELLCILINYKGPVDFSRLEERYQYNDKYFM
jgi:hypothetical protein